MWSWKDFFLFFKERGHTSSFEVFQMTRRSVVHQDVQHLSKFSKHNGLFVFGVHKHTPFVLQRTNLWVRLAAGLKIQTADQVSRRLMWVAITSSCVSRRLLCCCARSSGPATTGLDVLFLFSILIDHLNWQKQLMINQQVLWHCGFCVSCICCFKYLHGKKPIIEILLKGKPIQKTPSTCGCLQSQPIRVSFCQLDLCETNWSCWVQI